MIRWLSPFLLSLLFFLYPCPSFAHAFGKLYNLPVPFWLYLYGAAAALVVSFLIIGYFLNRREKALSYKTFDLSKIITLSKFAKKRFLAAGKMLSAFFLFLTILSGLIGQDSSFSNFNMVFFWVVFLLGLTYLTVFFGNIYSVANPWRTIVELFKKELFDKDSKVVIKYPKVLGYYPALFLYFLLIWFELIGQTTPFKLSSLLLQYTIINIIGVILVGKQNWFRYFEFFNVFFGLIGKMSPLEMKNGKPYLRPPFVGLLKERAEHFSLLLFTIFMLSSTAFDGFRETLPFVRLYWAYIDAAIRPIFGEASYTIFQTVGLFLSPFIFLSIYLVFISTAKIITKSKNTIHELSLQFAFALVPIAFVYNIAHYFNLLFTEGPNIIRFISDPFGFGWNLFGTASYYESVILDAGLTWHFQVGVILFGHIVGVYLAHIVALNLFPSQKKALLSQLPMLLLMVSYTIIGLWILSQPITSGL